MLAIILNGDLRKYHAANSLAVNMIQYQMAAAGTTYGPLWKS
jgi:hypothetical protein